MKEIERCMLGKDLILTLAARTGGEGSVVILCTEAGEIQSKLLLKFVNDKPIMKEL